MSLEPFVEHIWIEISGKNKNSNVLLGVFYQPDSDPVKKCAWVEKFETILAAVHSKWDGTLAIAGDINIDITNPSSFAQKYQGILRSFNLNQHIKDPTRKGKWLIDHIATNIPNNVIATGVIPTPEVSDHDMPYIIVNARLSRFEARFKYIRSVRSFCSEDFVRDVSELPFSLVYAVDDPDEKISILNDLLRTCIDLHAPLVRCKITRPPAPWLKDVNIQNLQSERDRLRFTAHQTQTESDWSLYRSIRNRIKTVIKTAKRTFYSKALSSKRSKVVWSIIHRILNPNRKRIRQDPDDLNKFFVTTSERILGTYPEQRTDVVAYLDSLPEICGKTSFEMRKVHFYEVNKQLNSIRNDCSTGHDHLPVYYLKLASQYIVFPLTHIINECIAQNKFPSSWKIGRISPIPKINDPTKNSDFRPVSVLPILSKVYERLVLSQLVEHIESSTLYKETMSGFRKGHLTAVVLLKLKDDILKAMKKGEITLAVFTDYSKAFDTVDFQVLLNKLHRLGFPKKFLIWTYSYLEGRQQFVQIDDRKSGLLPVAFGVPQGFILGPVLFNLYMEKSDCNYLQYADDTSLYQHCKVKNLDKCGEDIGRELTRAYGWSTSSNLLLNPDKTKMMIFSTTQMSTTHNLSSLDLVKLSINGRNIERKI